MASTAPAPPLRPVGTASPVGLAADLPPPLIVDSQRLPVPRPAKARRYRVVDDDGLEKEQLLTGEGSTAVCFQFVRTLQDCLMGKVKSAVICKQRSDGSYAVPKSGPFTQVAVKILIKACVAKGETRDGKKVKEDPMAEVGTLAFMAHPAPGSPYLLQLLHFMEDSEMFYIVYSFLNSGEMFDQISADGRMREAFARKYFFDALQGLRYMHQRGVSHRDISLENIMLHRDEHDLPPDDAEELIEASIRAAAAFSPEPPNTAGGELGLPGAPTGGGADPHIWRLAPGSRSLKEATENVEKALRRGEEAENGTVIIQAPPRAKIIDFGLAVVMPPIKPATAPGGALFRWDGRVGKERYMPPEMWAGKPYDGKKVDSWTLGVTLFVLLFGIFPYKLPAAKHCAYFAQIESGRLGPMLKDWQYDRVVSAPALDLIERLLRTDPSRRIGTEDIHNHPWLKPERDRVAATANAHQQLLRQSSDSPKDRAAAGSGSASRP